MSLKPLLGILLLCSALLCPGASSFNGKSLFAGKSLFGCDAPVITAQPASLSCLTNATTNFTVTATGTALTYQWKTNGVNVSNGTQYAGATATTVWASNVTILQSNLSFVCEVAGQCGAVTSSAAILTVTNGVGGSFDPATYSPLAWFAADYAVTNSGGTPAVNNDTIQFIGDKSGNANVLNDPNFTFTFKTSQQNGLPAIEIANGGSLSKSVFQQGTISQPFTLYVAAKHTSSGSYKIVFSGAGFGTDSCGIDDTSHAYLNAPTIVASAGTVSAAWHVFTFIFDGASSSIRVDGTQIATGDPGATSLVGIRLGNRSDNDLRWNSQIGENLIFSGHHDSTHLGNMETYLGRWQ